ncbi:uncharacterized protein LOC123701078 isoform X2 [Colias croceus]|uniref:uncharacterized protein LOC123701078 isoform X1 n=1 Tax=Colias crocea TaxID=72248 RepID=UPI001E27C366|nr:uncharacterized protein LOC123701078 isoform X1 [Colias croceus]XP_045504454.1 uncharacterized protein LOC123701078 isoform X2 [Colias croceus]
MRTSHPQYTIMVEFMEKHGDLSKPSGGPRGRHYVQQKWKELIDMLNSDGTGDSRTEEKWRKVWSDFKNNVKKKWAKINRSAQGTGGGPAIQLTLTDLENRVLNLIGVQAATGMPIQEAGFVQVVGGEDVSLSGVQVPATETVDELTVDYAAYEYTPIPEDEWNTAGTSSQPTVAPPLPPPTPPTALTPPPGPVQTQWQPPKKKKKPEDLVIKVFKECERNAREYEKERDRIAQELERERIRQRDVELQLQAQWLDFMREALKVVNKYLEKRSE